MNVQIKMLTGFCKKIGKETLEKEVEFLERVERLFIRKLFGSYILLDLLFVIHILTFVHSFRLECKVPS